MEINSSGKSFIELAEKILATENKHSQKIIAIDGGGGAGKSTFADQLQKHLPNASIIHIDDFYKGPWNARLDHTDYEVNPFFDWDRFEREVLQPVRQGRSVRYHIYDWHTHTVDTVATVPDDAVIIIEGGYTTQRRFSEVYDLKIWIEADEDTRLDKALTRDGEHIRFLWEEDWLPVERNYIEKDNPRSKADLVVKGHSGDFSDGSFEILEH